MMDYIEIYKSKTQKSYELYKKLNKIIPGGASHNIRFYPPYPIFIEKCTGSKIFDVDGNEYIDLWMGHYSHILGHNPDIIREAIIKVSEIGSHSGCVNPYEIKLAELIIKYVPGIERLKFCCSGTEATTYAVRISRAYTGKDIVLKVAGGWHGAGSELTKAIKYPYSKKITSGIPKELLSKTDYIFFNDIIKTKEVINRYKDNLACIILEPVIGEGGFLPADRDFLEFLREITEKLGAILIFDEIITGFRISIGGAQKYYNIIPDLTTMGKIAGGGFNIGIVGGKNEIMEITSVIYEGENKVLIGGGTFSETPYSMLAGYTVIEYLSTHQEIYNDLNYKGESVRKNIAKFIRDKKIKAIVTGTGSLYMIHFPYRYNEKITSPQDIGEKTDLMKREHEFKVRMLNEGIHVMHGGGAISTVHSKDDLDKIIETTKKVLTEMNLQK